MTKPTSTLGKFFSGLATIYRIFRSIVLNLVFLFILLVVLGSLVGEPPAIVHPGSALVLNPDGIIVDQLTYVDPANALLADSVGNNERKEVLLQDLLDAIDRAATDDDISAIVMGLNNLQPSGFSKLQEVGDALVQFRESGKKVYAYADNYSQGQYYLAAFADEIILNSIGQVWLEGFSTYPMFYREALDKLGVNVHVFRVGEYKSAVEQYERNDMSAEAKEENLDWLGDLWRQYVDRISEARGLEPGFIDDYINHLDEQLAEFNGSTAQLALARNLVDSLMNRGQVNDYLRDEIGPGSSDDDFLSIGFDDYLSSRNQDDNLKKGGGKVGIIVASGTIYDGRRDAGEIGGDSLQELVSRAIADDDIKALVLRIDSGGGSAYASEVIRNELVRLKEAGKPLVVSMGSVAASGGYWISTPADEIWASASTITGSIGIYGLFPTFEGSFDILGVNTDGVGTTDLAGVQALGRGLPEIAGNVLQLTLEDGYNRFINLVAESRDMNVDDVDAIARGRVWSGEDALNLGLVDKLGNLEDAVASAAAMAGLESWQTQLIEQQLTPGQQFLQDLADNIMLKAVAIKQKNPVSAVTVLSGFYRTINEDLQELVRFNDPGGLYLHCQECSSFLSL